MSVKYTPVQWTNSKIFYDLIVLVLVFVYVLIYLRLTPQYLGDSLPADGAIVRARAFGTCAFLLLTLTLCIGPLARIDKRFLPLLYNRRHLGVVTFLVALTHAAFVLNWYFNFSPTPRFEALLTSNTGYAQLLGFPFETLGIMALLAMAALATTSHDFWLNFLTARTWKWLHYGIYFAYAMVIGHVALGSLQSENNSTFTIIVGLSVVLVCGLHACAALLESRHRKATAGDDGWHLAGGISDFIEGQARITQLSNGDRGAVFCHENALSAIGNACAHQHGPLGEGRIIDGCVTCPWHGFQYRLTDGCSPAPFTEKVPTYNLRIEGTSVQVFSEMNQPGTHVEPIPLPKRTNP